MQKNDQITQRPATALAQRASRITLDGAQKLLNTGLLFDRIGMSGQIGADGLEFGALFV